MIGVDLFAGPGGLTLGLKSTGVQTIVAVEKRKYALETFAKHSPAADLICEDIRTLEFGHLRGQVDIVYGGPPCQPFSTGGLRRGTDDRRNMVPEFLRAVREMLPDVVLLENVPGLTTRKNIGYFRSVVEEVASIGYEVNWEILNAADYGLPQKRRRVFIVGLREKQFRFPKPTHGPGRSAPHLPSGTVVSRTHVLGEPPDCPVRFAKFPDLRKSPHAGHIYNGGGRPLDLESPSPTILASAGGYKTHWVDTQGIAVKYHAHLLAGGDPWEGEVEGARRLSVEESAKLQTFPDSLSFSGSRSEQYTQVGDAVPPRLAQILGSEVMRQLSGGDVDSSTHSEPRVVPTLFHQH